jgi:ubiquinone/menaquinone biosynthesis C-methylase UbiE
MATWTAERYGANTGHHRRFDSTFLDGWALPEAGKVLDIGCGIGDFTVKLVGGQRTVLGVDPSAELIAAAQQRFGDQVRFWVARGQQLRGVSDGTIEAAVSRSALHWVPASDHPQVLAEVARVLSPTAVFRAEFAADGQMPEVRAVLDSELDARGLAYEPWYFAELDDYATLITEAGLSVESGWLRVAAQARHFTAADLVGWLSSQVVIAYESLMDKGEFASFRDIVIGRSLSEIARDGSGYVVEFRRLDVLARPA